MQSLLLQKSAVSGFCFLCLYWLWFHEKTLSIYVNDLGLLWNVCNGTWVIFFGSFRYMIVTKLPDPLALCLQKSLMVLEIKCPVWKHLLFSIQSLLSKRFPPTISSCLFSDTRTLACSLYWVVSEVTYVVGNFFRYSVCSSAVIFLSGWLFFLVYCVFFRCTGNRNTQCCQRKVLCMHLFSWSHFGLEKQSKCTSLYNVTNEGMELHL